MIIVNDTKRWLYKAIFIILILNVSILHTRNKNGSGGGLVQCTEEFNTQIMDRVQERIEELMNIPVQQCRRFIQYRNIEGFHNNDIAAIRSVLYTESSTAIVAGIPAVLYIGLEDGTIIYVYDNLVSGEYREPGNSGYNATDAMSDPTHPYHKHVNTCVDKMNGKPMPCILQPHEQYIQCINNCEYVPCANNHKNVEEDNKDTKIITDTSSTNQTTKKSTSTIYCKNYEVKEVEENSDKILGYVPRTDMCYNQYGQPEQRPGYALTNYFTDPPTFGTCYYGDGKTIVNRTISGNYAACPAQPQQEGDDNNNNNNTCNTAFTGGYVSDSFDPRYRDWYMSTKQYQKDVWTAPYAFSGGAIVIGITYSEPLYNLVEYQPTSSSTTTNDKKVFQGVIAVDYDLQSICTFLIQSFGDTDMKILIVEQDAPYYVIASSVPGSSVTKLILQTAAGEDEQPILCPSNTTNTDCIPDRVTINEFEAMGDDSLVLYRAFEVQKQQNFPEQKQVNFKIHDPIGSPAYVSQAKPYSQSNNLHWYIIVVLPMEQSSSDAVLPGDPMFPIIIVSGALGFFGCLILLLKFYSKRKERAVIQADWRFTCAFIAGCTVLNLSTFTLVGENTNPNCMLRMWSFNALFVCALSPLFVKVWRMAKLLTAPSGFQRSQVNNVQAFLLTLPLIAIEIILLTIFSIVDPPRQTESLGVGDGIGLQQVTCTQNTNAFFITQTIFDAILVFIGCFLAYSTRNLDPKFGEAKQLGFSMYNIAFTGIIILGIVNLVDMDEVSQITLQAVGILWGSFFCSFAFVLPRLLEVGRDKRAYQNPSSINQAGGQFTNNNNNNNNNTNNGSPNTPDRTNRRKNSALGAKLPAAPSLEHPLPIGTAGAGLSSTNMDSDSARNDPKDSGRNKNRIVSNLSFPFTTWETTAEKINPGNLDLSAMDTPNKVETAQTLKGSDRSKNRIVSNISFPFSTWETTVETVNPENLDLSDVDTPSNIDTTQIPSADTSNVYIHTVGEALDEAVDETVHPTN